MAAERSSVRLSSAGEDRLEAAIEGEGAYREALPEGGRVHVDRPLPFLLLNRFDPGDEHSLARRVAATGSAYVAWPAGHGGEVADTVAAVVARQHRHWRRVLLVSLYDLPREHVGAEAPRLERYLYYIAHSGDAAAAAAADRLEEALAGLVIDLRRPEVERLDKGPVEAEIEELVGEDHVSHISLGLPQNYRVPGGEDIYPQLRHELEIGIFDALLRAGRAFAGELSERAVPHHRAFGRSFFVDAARIVDRKLDAIARSFDFLLGVSPINSAQAFKEFRAGGCESEPEFRYRPLAVDPEAEKRRLFEIDLRPVEDPVLETLFSEKRRELEQQLTMLQCRNTRNFRYSSLMVYGPVAPDLLAAANEILAEIAPRASGADEHVGAEEVREAATRLIARYHETDGSFDCDVRLREDIAAGLMVSGRHLYVSTATSFRRRRLDPLLQHEISVHLLTFVNGDAQSLKIFCTGLAGYEGIQEGLGVFAEGAVGGLTRARIRLLAARVLAVDAMLKGADFVETFRLLRKDHGYSRRGAFNIAARVYRSGGLAKDAIYLRGFKQVIDLLGEGRSLDPFWYGKIAEHHVGIVEELALRGLLRRPAVTPEFLSRQDARRRIAALREEPSILTLVASE
ncbi:MAG: flavohemoglobin expression-modulating QEGLA motif protein [Sphingomonadaceae bacterium]